MKRPGRMTRRELALALGAAPAAARPAADPRQVEQPRRGRLRSAAARLRTASVARNISPAFRFIP